jgi:O-antigen ligase
MTFDPGLGRRAAGWLLILFAFSAWNMTGVANGALGLLALLFLLDLPRAWPRLRTDPAFLLMLATPLITALLAWRAIGLFPDSAHAQWEAVTAWSAPMAFVIAAWWLRGDERLIRRMLAAAALGLTLGVLRKLDWDQIPAMLAGERYVSAYPALVLGFLASLMLVGLLALRGRLVGLSIGGLPLPWLGWGLWALGVGVAVGFLVVSQARGSALSLGLIALGLLGVRALRRNPATSAGPSARMLALLLGGALVLSGLVLVSSSDRIAGDVRIFSPRMDPAAGPVFDYEASSGIRLNLYRIGLRLIATRPWLGWGPGSDASGVLIPARVIPFADEDIVRAPAMAHLHSVPIEIGVRFGVVGLALALWFLVVTWKGYRALARGCRDPGLLLFLVVAGLLTLLFCLYDFRLTHMDLRFVFIALFGMVYGFVYAEDVTNDEP